MMDVINGGLWLFYCISSLSAILFHRKLTKKYIYIRERKRNMDCYKKVTEEVVKIVKMLKNEHLQSTMTEISKSVALKEGFLLLLFIVIWFEKKVEGLV